MPVILFDLDGTLIDVSGSYDFAVARTVELYCKKVAGLSVEGELVTFDELAALRSAGGFNNDWDLAAGLTIWALDQFRGSGPGATVSNAVYSTLPSVIDRIRAGGGGLTGLGGCVEQSSLRLVRHSGSSIHTSSIVRIFQEVYLGEQFRPVYGLSNEYWDGPAACRRERPLLRGTVLEELAERGSPGIVTGRPKLEAELAVSMLSEWLSPRVVVSDDDLVDASGRHRPDWRKPAGEPLRMALEQIGGAIQRSGDVPWRPAGRRGRGKERPEIDWPAHLLDRVRLWGGGSWRAGRAPTVGGSGPGSPEVG